MKLKPFVVSLSLAMSGAAFAATDLGVLDASGQDFSRSFLRIFDWGSKLGSFTDHYTFTLNAPSGAVGTAFVVDWGSLDLSLTSVALSSSSGLIASDSTPNTFAFSNLGAGTYDLGISGTLKALPGPLGFAQYSGSIHSVASAAPEPEALGMALAGLLAVGLLARRRALG
jgi:MYXO-CTERM domain-containing protein